MAASGHAITVIARVMPPAVGVSASGGPAVIVAVAAAVAIGAVGYAIYKHATAPPKSAKS